MIPKLYLGPMSKNIVDAAVEFSNENIIPVGFCASRRQVEFNGGYVNNWTTKSFTDYVRSNTQESTLVRDHGGPGQGQNYDDGVESFSHDTVLFDIVHIDPWKIYKSIEDGMVETSKYITLCDAINRNCRYEVGTEQSIREMTPDDLFNFLGGLLDNLGETLFSKILYVVIQSGTSLEEDKNTGEYDVDKLKRMVDICKKFSVLSKEHNGDYLAADLIKEKFYIGLDSINIAPEFGVIETLCILDRIDDDITLLGSFHSMCVESGKWEKWVGVNFDPFADKKQLIKICGHYLFSDKRFKLLMKNKIFDGIDLEIKSKVKARIKDILN